MTKRAILTVYTIETGAPLPSFPRTRESSLLQLGRPPDGDEVEGGEPPLGFSSQGAPREGYACGAGQCQGFLRRDHIHVERQESCAEGGLLPASRAIKNVDMRGRGTYQLTT